jgi:hypothetical protein
LTESPSVCAAAAIDCVGLHLDVEQPDHVDTQLVERDQRILVEPRHLELHRRQPHLHQFVEHRDHHDTAVEHDLLAAETGRRSRSPSFRTPA